MKRRICWPDPDATCLEGGCGWCNDHRFRSFAVISRYVRQAGMLPNRGLGEQEAVTAWETGLRNNFFNRPDVKA